MGKWRAKWGRVGNCEYQTNFCRLSKLVIKMLIVVVAARRSRWDMKDEQEDEKMVIEPCKRKVNISLLC